MKWITASLAVGLVVVGLFAATSAFSAISASAVKANAKALASKTCSHDSNCDKYAFNDCRKHNDGASCYIYNFEFTPKSGRYTCVERAFWHQPTSRPIIIQKFDCSINGWHFQ